MGMREGITIAGNILVDIVKMIERYPEKICWCILRIL